MAVQALRRKLLRLEGWVAQRTGPGHQILDELRSDPTRLMTRAGMAPDPWQEGLLRSEAAQMLLLCSRQSGKSTVAAALALRAALLTPRSLVLVLSPSQRQSAELFRKVVDLFGALGQPVGVAAESALRMELVNGSRVVSLPGDEKNIRCFSGVALLVIDEAARVADGLYYSVRPMLAVSQGRLVALSTPYGKRGWFHDEWHGEGEWERVRITAPECPRIPAEFLRDEERAIGTRWFRQEYLCSFESTIDAVFSEDEIQAMFVERGIQPIPFD
jgi:hypothetical protein